MRVVYEAAGLIDAHLVKHALEATEIPVFLKCEALLGGMGELPLFGVVQVCVPDSAWPEARKVVDALDLGSSVGAVEEPTEWGGGLLPARG